MSKTIIAKCVAQLPISTQRRMHFLCNPPRLIPYQHPFFKRDLHVTCVAMTQKLSKKQELMVKKFLDHENKNRENFLISVQQFVQKRENLKNQAEFIRAALKQLKTFNVHKDLEVYKSLIEIMPKDIMVPTNSFQVMHQHFPVQQSVCVEVLEQMSKNIVMPDAELQDIVQKRFGQRSSPFFKLCRMYYWMPKMKYRSPWLLPDDLPLDSYALAHLAISRIASVDPASVISTYQTIEIEDSNEDTWIISAGSPEQHAFIREHDKTKPVKVEGPFGIYLRNFMVSYYILRADPKPAPDVKSKRELDDVSKMDSWMVKKIEKESKLTKLRSVHDQDDGIILSYCATGTSSRNSVLAWVRHLQMEIPELEDIPILFTQTSPVGHIMSPDDLKNAAERQDKAVKAAKEKPTINVKL